MEQLYTFPWAELRQVLPRYRQATELIWVQEEPLNMGAWRYLEAKLRELVAEGHKMEIRYVGRPERASPAEGYPAAHAAEQSRIIREALGTETARAPLKTMATREKVRDKAGGGEENWKGGHSGPPFCCFSPSRR